LPVCFSLPAGRQVSFFLLHKQKKEHKTYSNSFYVLFALMQMGNPQDYGKKIKANPPRRTAGLAGPTHMKTLILCN
jgi:hypothetical protein